jgi:2-keto-3-deoxy-L-rhamnonate aldolase RhmA
MGLLPGYSYKQQVSIVANTAEAINEEIAAQEDFDFIVTQMVDKPATNEVYLLFAKSEPAVIA